MASIRQVLLDRARHHAVMAFIAAEQRPWERWEDDPAVAESLALVGDDSGALSRVVPIALNNFCRSPSPVNGLMCVYLIQALVVAELPRADAAPRN